MGVSALDRSNDLPAHACRPCARAEGTVRELLSGTSGVTLDAAVAELFSLRSSLDGLGETRIDQIGRDVDQFVAERRRAQQVVAQQRAAAARHLGAFNAVLRIVTPAPVRAATPRR